MATDDWKHRGGARPGRPATAAKAKGRSRLALALFPLLVAVGAVVGLAFYWGSEPAPLFLSVPVSEYQDWPENAWARQDADALAEFFPGGDTQVATESQEQVDGFERELKELGKKAQGKSSRPVVIHLCALGVAEANSVYLLPAKAVPGRRDKWLPLAAVLDAVGKIDGRRLLLLDVRPVTDLRFGQPADLSRALDKELTAAAATLSFLVGAHCAPAEYPYVSPELRNGAFAEFLARGLAGHADGATGTPDKRVSAVELVTYARARVVQWQTAHGVPVAAPVLYGPATDFDLLAVKQGDLPWAGAGDPPAPSKVVSEGWTAVDAWRDAGVPRTAPRTMRHLHELVARSDRRVAGGRDLGQTEAALTAFLKRAEEQRTALAPTPYPVVSVARTRRVPVAKPEEVKAAVDPLLAALRAARVGSDPAAKPDPKVMELAKLQQALWDKPPEAAPYPYTVPAVCDILTTSDAEVRKPEELALFLTALRGFKPRPGHVELDYLALLANPKVRNREYWPSSLGRDVLATAIASEAAVAVPGRAVLRVKDRLETTDKDFRSCLSDLFLPQRPKWVAAGERLSALPRQYEGIGELAAECAAAVVEWEEDVALLPMIGDFAPADASAQTVFDDAYKALATAARDLRRVIDLPAADLERLRSARGEASDARKKLTDLCRDVPSSAGAVELRARLALPGRPTAERGALAERADGAARQLAEEVLKAPTVTDGEARKRSTDDAAFDAAAARRVRRATLLLGAADLPGPALPTEWRDALVANLLRKYTAEPTPAVRERFAWLIHPTDLPAVPPTGTERHDPGALLRRQTDKEAADWLAAGRYTPLAADMNQAAEFLKGRESDPAAPRALAGAMNAVADALTGWKP